MDLSSPRVMGILNVTPDSFYADSRMSSDEQIASRQPFPGPGLAIRLICHDKKEEVIISSKEIETPFAAACCKATPSS